MTKIRNYLLKEIKVTQHTNTQSSSSKINSSKTQTHEKENLRFWIYI